MYRVGCNVSFEYYNGSSGMAIKDHTPHGWIGSKAQVPHRISVSIGSNGYIRSNGSLDCSTESKLPMDSVAVLGPTAQLNPLDGVN